MKRIALGFAVFCIAFELSARFFLGLGDPPLYIADPSIEYMVKPGIYHRFGNTSIYNRYSMRSREVPETAPGELRVLVIGDSVVNGGVQTDQADLATTIIENRLRMYRPAFVGNVSAGSWGPPNMLAYVQRFGFFEADVVVLVLNSADEADVPTFDVVGVLPDYPAEKPVLAIQELVARYGVRFWRELNAAQTTVHPANDADRAVSLGALRDLIRLAKPRIVIVAQHLAREELGGYELPGYFAIKEIAEREGVRLVKLHLRPNEYRDSIHPNASGQKAIADQLLLELVDIAHHSEPNALKNHAEPSYSTMHH